MSAKRWEITKLEILVAKTSRLNQICLMQMLLPSKIQGDQCLNFTLKFLNNLENCYNVNKKIGTLMFFDITNKNFLLILALLV